MSLSLYARPVAAAAPAFRIVHEGRHRASPCLPPVSRSARLEELVFTTGEGHWHGQFHWVRCIPGTMSAMIPGACPHCAQEVKN